MLPPVANTELTDLVAVQPIQQSECTPYVMPPLPPRAPLSMLLPIMRAMPLPVTKLLSGEISGGPFARLRLRSFDRCVARKSNLNDCVARLATVTHINAFGTR